MRGFNYRKAVQALNYLACNNGGTLNKMKAIKMIWLADRLHIRKYGRSITGDEYYAVPFGPIPSATRDILECNPMAGDLASEYAKDFIKGDKKYTFKSLKDPELKVFSQTDIQIINTIIENFNHREEFELSKYSHTFPEWKKYESALNKGVSSRFPINQADFFINVEEKSGLFVDAAETLEDSKIIFEETSDILSLLQ